MLELLINKNETLKTIMLTENGILVEKHEEHENQKRLEGNIYIGKVEKILPGMQSAFINIGEEKNTLIKLKDVLPKEDETKSKCKDEVNIKDVLTVDQKIIIQIKKDGTLSKGAKVSTHLNIPGRFVVFMPNTNFVTISQKIEDQTERKRLLDILDKNKLNNEGFIVRTAAEKRIETEIVDDIKLIRKKWEHIQKRIKANEEILVYDNNALIRRTLIDIIDRGLNRIIVNNKETYDETIKILKEYKSNIEVVLKENENLFSIYTLENQIEKLQNRKIWLKSGGFITIDKTEALTAIDVNTGKYTGKNDLEKTVYVVNEEATREIAKQLRLRDIGGIIIIDYIDMHIDENKQRIEKCLEKCLKNDRAKCQVAGFTKLNLLEMTRKNMCNNDWYDENN